MSRGKFILIISVSSFICILGILGFVVFRCGTMPVPPMANQPQLSFSLVGVIKSIEGDVLTVEAAKTSNSVLLSDRTYKITIDDATKIVRTNEPMKMLTSLDADGGVVVSVTNMSDQPIDEQELISKTDLKAGKWALFVNNQNIQLADDLTARKIYYLSAQ